MSTAYSPTTIIWYALATEALQDRISKNSKQVATDIDNAANAFVDAFKADFFTENLLGGSKDMSLAFQLQRCQVAAAVIGGEVYVAEIPVHSQLCDGRDLEQQDQTKAFDIAGVALWFPPGREMLDSDEQLQAGAANFLANLEPTLSEWWTKDLLPGFSRLADESYGKGVRRDSWHLLQIGVRPSYQKRGVASRLVEVVKQKALASNSTMTLEAETEANVAIYERLGFNVRGQTMMEGLVGRFPIFAMSSSPQTSNDKELCSNQLVEI